MVPWERTVRRISTWTIKRRSWWLKKTLNFNYVPKEARFFYFFYTVHCCWCWCFQICFSKAFYEYLWIILLGWIAEYIWTHHLKSLQPPQVIYHLPGTASPRTGTWHSANNKAIQEFLKRHGAMVHWNSCGNTRFFGMVGMEWLKHVKPRWLNHVESPCMSTFVAGGFHNIG